MAITTTTIIMTDYDYTFYNCLQESDLWTEELNNLGSGS